MAIENIPISTLNSLAAYARDKCPTGGFLYAVLTNDLFEAIGRADDFNRAALFDICNYIYNELPLSCWGSKDKVKQWLSLDDSD